MFSNPIKSKLPDVGTTIFTTMTKMANDYNAINLSQGFPNFACSELLIELVNKYMKAGENQYAPMQGMPVLREALANKIRDSYAIEVSPETEINITAGATQALYAAITAVVHKGDEVLVFSPAYDSYVPAIELSGGIPVFVKMRPPNFSINWDDVQEAISPKTKLILINTPHNPTGSVLGKADMEALQELTNGTDIIILSDEVYEHIIFDGLQHESVLKYPSLAERSFAVFSFGKTFHVTGWKMGYCVAPAYLMKEFRNVHQFEVFTVNRPIQLALAEFLKNKEEYLNLSAFYQEKRDFFLEGIEDSRFDIIPTKGTYFQLLGYEKITDESDVAFCERMTKEMGVASIPISVFYPDREDNKVLRFCFAKVNETLEKATQLLCKI